MIEQGKQLSATSAKAAVPVIVFGIDASGKAKAGRFLEKQRIEQRTMYDLEMLEQMGFCNGIENYSRHLSGRKTGEPPPTLIDYFPKDFLLIVDESHQTIQIGRAHV